MKSINKEVIAEIREKADIVDVISQYVPVEKKGKSHVCICPFHDDTSPSLMISQEKQIYRCFACGASGNVFRFVEHFEKISFQQAVAKIGKQLGYDLQVGKTPIKQNPEYIPYYEVLNEAIKYSQYQITVHAIAENFLKTRSIETAQINKFEIGYDDGKLGNYLIQKGFEYEQLKEAYIIHDNITSFDDVFKDRILFPIHDLDGNPVGFTARTLINSEAKYINTKETKIYVKGELIYNYHRVKQKEQKKDKVYLVEGTMDVIAFDKAGIDDCVAILGTAVTPHQIKALKKLAAPINVCFDGDQAGRNATYKFGILACEQQLNFEIVDWGSEKDPDEFLKSEGKETFLKTVDKTISWVAFLFQYLKTKYNLENYSDKKQYAQEIAQYIQLVKDEVERNAYYDILKQYTSFDYSTQHINKKQTIVYSDQLVLRNNIEKAQLEIINQILLSKRACDIYRHTLGVLPTKSLNEIAVKIIELYHEYVEIPINVIAEYFTEEMTTLILKMQDNELFVKHFDENIIYDNIKLIQIYLLEQEQQKISAQIKSEISNEQRTKLMMQSIELTKSIQKLKIGGKND